MKKILIIGATGFIGSHLTEEAFSRGYEIHITSRASSSLEYLSSIPITNHRIDLFNEDALRSLISEQNFDYIIQNAGIYAGTSSSDYYKINASLIGKICKLLKEEKMWPKRLVYISSLAALGPADYDVRGAIHQDTFPRPLTTYGKSKLQGEELLNQFGAAPYMIIRPTAVFGPRDTAFLPIFRMVQRGFKIYPQSKNQELSFIYVKDLAAMTLDLMEQAPAYLAYNLSNPESITSRQFYEEIFPNGKTRIDIELPLALLKLLANTQTVISKLFGSKTPILNREKIAELTAQSWRVDTESTDLLDIKPRYTFSEAIAETISWYKQQKLL